jgi:hypothetical protein
MKQQTQYFVRTFQDIMANGEPRDKIYKTKTPQKTEVHPCGAEKNLLERVAFHAKRKMTPGIGYG